MVYTAHVRNGVITLDDPVRLPEGTAVSVHVPAAEPAPDQNGGPSLLDRLQGVVGAAQGLPVDAAANVDHYLYGHPRT